MFFGENRAKPGWPETLSLTNQRGRHFPGTKALASPSAREGEEETQRRVAWGAQDTREHPGRPAARA